MFANSTAEEVGCFLNFNSKLLPVILILDFQDYIRFFRKGPGFKDSITSRKYSRRAYLAYVWLGSYRR